MTEGARGLHTCSCRTTQRTLVLFAQNLAQNYPELILFGRQANWRFYADLDAFAIEIGGKPPTSSLTDLVKFLRGVFNVARLNVLRGAWIDQGVPIHQQLVKLIHAGPLVDMAPLEDQSLVNILYSGRIETWFQPIFWAKEQRRLWGYECLLRGSTESGEIILPLSLIRQARQENLVFMLDRICRETHLRNAGRLIPNLAALSIIVNFLPSSVYQPEFCLRSTMAAANEAGLRPQQVFFEVVETEEIPDVDHLKLILTHYRQHGFQVSLDDIGSGFASLNLYAELNPDLIKIDKALFERAPTSEIHQSICRAIVQIGRDQQKLVLAEGIETAQQYEIAQQMGVDLMQGYYLGRPNPTPLA